MLELFFIKVLIVGIGVAIATSLVGVFVLWKKASYFSDAISHSAIFGLGAASVVAILPIYGIGICAVVFCGLIFYLQGRGVYSYDAIIGIVSCILISLGMVLMALFPSNINLESYLFGDLIIVSDGDILLVYSLALIVVVAMFFWFKDLLLATINTDLAQISGVKVNRLELKFLLLTALVVAGLVKIIGIFLITSMMIMPAAIARNFSKTPVQMLFISLATALLIMVGGLFVALFFDLPSSPAIISFAALLFVCSIISTKICDHKSNFFK